MTLPVPLRGARWSTRRAATAGVLLVVLVAAAVFATRVALARAASEPRPVAPAPAGATLVRGTSTFAASATSSGGGGPPTATTGTTVTVHVVGLVAHPGVVRLASGARVADAVAEAGGATKGADLAALNLARVLVDGEQVRVPRPGETVIAPTAPPGTPSSGGTAGASGPGVGALVDLNTATAAQLEDLPGVGPVLAQRILDWRTEHGRFTSTDELGEVSGIGEKTLAQLKPKVTV